MNTRTALTPTRTIYLASAASAILDESTPITKHISAVVAAAAQCHGDNTDHLGNCGTCPLTAATHTLADYITGGFAGARGPLVGANH